MNAMDFRHLYKLDTEHYSEQKIVRRYVFKMYRFVIKLILVAFAEAFSGIYFVVIEKTKRRPANKPCFQFLFINQIGGFLILAKRQLIS